MCDAFCCWLWQRRGEPGAVIAQRYLALLRGINVGRNHRIGMAGLRELLAELGYDDVSTYLQSGNALLTARASPADVGARIRGAIADRFGFDVAVVVRTPAELDRVVRTASLLEVMTDPKKMLVSFLSGEPDRAHINSLDPARFEPERFAVDGRELFVWLPDGVQNAKVLKELTDRKLGVTATARNWATVTKLRELAAG